MPKVRYPVGVFLLSICTTHCQIRQKKEINRQLMILADGFNQEKEKIIYATSR